MDSRSRSLLTKYNLTTIEYAQMAIEQGGACKCCGNIPKGDYPLHVDHSHRIANLKIHVLKGDGWFTASIEEFPAITFTSESREDAVTAAKKFLKRKSVRGLICWKCNTVLRWARDSVEILLKCAKYLDEFAKTL